MFIWCIVAQLDRILCSIQRVCVGYLRKGIRRVRLVWAKLMTRRKRCEKVFISLFQNFFIPQQNIFFKTLQLDLAAWVWYMKSSCSSVQIMYYVFQSYMIFLSTDVHAASCVGQALQSGHVSAMLRSILDIYLFNFEFCSRCPWKFFF